MPLSRIGRRHGGLVVRPGSRGSGHAVAALGRGIPGTSNAFVISLRQLTPSCVCPRYETSTGTRNEVAQHASLCIAYHQSLA